MENNIVMETFEEGNIELEIVIPPQAIGLIIGKKSASINALRQLDGIQSVLICDLDIKPSCKNLKIIGTPVGVRGVEEIINHKISHASHNLANQSRALHSWTLSHNGTIFTPREVHKTGHHVPPKGSKQWAKEKELTVMAFVGAKRGDLATIADYLIVIDSEHYGRVEDCHMGICHMLCYSFMEIASLKQ